MIRETMLRLAREKLAEGGVSSLGMARAWIERHGPFSGQGPETMDLAGVSLCGSPGAEMAVRIIEALVEAGAEMKPATSEQLAALAMHEKIGCLDDWPGGQELGYAIYDEIPWRLPEVAK